MRGTGLVVSLLQVVLAGCAERSTAGDPRETSDRFAGEWMVDQPFHALYEASWYFFHDGGQVEHLRDCSFGGEVPTGVVSDASDSLRCQFGDRWSAPDADTLVIDGACSDGRPREIVLGFPADTTANAVGQSAIEVISVGGDHGWAHSQWEWAWQKCADTGCTPALDCP